MGTHMFLTISDFLMLLRRTSRWPKTSIAMELQGGSLGDQGGPFRDQLGIQLVVFCSLYFVKVVLLMVQLTVLAIEFY